MATEKPLSLGQKGERAAEGFLLKKGYKILHRNFKTRRGEIDLIVQEGETLVFVEVKSGKSDRDFPPSGHLTQAKQQKLLQLGKSYLAHLPRPIEARFDLITVNFSKDDLFVDHLKNVIQDA